MVDLMPCPFCQESNAVICDSFYHPDSRTAYAVSCRTKNCHGVIFELGMGLFATPDEAIAAWNSRQPATQADDALVEELARVIDPSSWAVMDSYLAQMLRKYKGENAAYDPEQYKHKESMAKARAILPILHRERAAAHAAGRAEGAEEMRHRALVICADQSYLDNAEQTTSQRIREIEIDAIERGQHKEQG